MVVRQWPYRKRVEAGGCHFMNEHHTERAVRMQGFTGGGKSLEACLGRVTPISAP